MLPALVRNNPIAIISGTTGNYRLSFDIKPAGTIAEWGSIVHFSAGTDANRSPGFWFWPGTTQLHVKIGDSTNSDWGIDRTDALPLNSRTTVTLECIGSDIKLTVGKKEYPAKQPTHRFSGGNLIVYAGDQCCRDISRKAIYHERRYIAIKCYIAKGAISRLIFSHIAK